MRKAIAQKYEKVLWAMADRIGGTVAGLEDAVRTPVGGQADGGPSGASLHLADLGTEADTQEIDSALLENEVYLRGEVDAALERIKGGNYGTCERCGKSIPAGRAAVRPLLHGL